MPMPPVSLPENAKVMEVDLVVPALVTALLFPSVAEFMEVFGGTVSTVQLNDEGAEALFPTLSSDNILSVWVPSPRLVEVNCNGLVDRKSTRLNSSHVQISFAVFCLK